MKKQLLLGITGLCLFSAAISVDAQKLVTTEQAPSADLKNPTIGTNKALWDIHFGHNLTSSASGDVGMAGACFFYNQFWVTRWASDTIYRFNTSGALVSEFVIPGLTGVRALTHDGNYLYASTNSTTIYRIDPLLQSLAPPHITVSSSLPARFCTYDANLNSGAGGFWIGNFTTDIEAIDMAGATLSSIPAATHGLTGMYGAAVDNFSAGGPFLWVFDQSGTNLTQINQILISTGATTGITHDVYPDFMASHSLTSALAGGLFISDQIVPGEVTIGGITQGTPNNVLFGYELTTASSSGINENENNNINVYPNPSNGIFTINWEGSQNAEYRIIDVNGKTISNGVLPSATTQIDISSFTNGTYILQVISGGKNIAEKTILKN